MLFGPKLIPILGSPPEEKATSTPIPYPTYTPST